jgi:hypothetical protein
MCFERAILCFFRCTTNPGLLDFMISNLNELCVSNVSRSLIRLGAEALLILRPLASYSGFTMAISCKAGGLFQVTN